MDDAQAQQQQQMMEEAAMQQQMMQDPNMVDMNGQPMMAQDGQ